jgi:hypothetical protein
MIHNNTINTKLLAEFLLTNNIEYMLIIGKQFDICQKCILNIAIVQLLENYIREYGNIIGVNNFIQTLVKLDNNNYNIIDDIISGIRGHKTTDKAMIFINNLPKVVLDIINNKKKIIKIDILNSKQIIKFLRYYCHSEYGWKLLFNSVKDENLKKGYIEFFNTRYSHLINNNFINATIN